MTDDARRAEPRAAEPGVPLAARAAAATFIALGIGFGAGAAVTLALFARDGELPMTPWGFRAFDGPFARIGDTETAVLGSAVVAVGAVDIAAGLGLWRGRRWAGLLGAATTPVALVLGAGFELPFLLLGVPARLAFLAAAWRRLR